MDFPPLAWPAELRDDHFMLLDESRLPDTVEYIRVDDSDGAVAAIRAMQTRAFGQLLTVLYALILTARKAVSPATLQGAMDSACEALNASRPTFAFQPYTDRVRAWTDAALRSDDQEPADTIVRRITGLLDRIKTMRLNRARMAAVLFDDGDTVLTHCNTSGELLLTARFCRNEGKGLIFFATETRPYFQGRLTAWELSMDGFGVTLIPDNRVASLLSAGRCTKVVTGADRVALNGDVVNKTGTRQLAMLAHRFGIPFYAFVQEPGKTATGTDVPIEYRDRTEVLRFRGKDVYPAGTDAFYPAFDLTPHRYVTALITFEKIVKPADLPAGWQISPETADCSMRRHP
jgi:methylthioribose-1-phosphate isomerase